MIEKMKKLSLIMSCADSESIIRDLQNMGTVHIEKSDAVDNEEAQSLIQLSEENKTILKNLARYKVKNPVKAGVETPQEHTAGQLREATQKLLDQISNLEKQIDSCSREIKELAPWEGYNPEILKTLEQQNIHISFHQLPTRIYDGLDMDCYTGVFEEILRQKDKIFFIRVQNSPAISEIDPSDEQIQITPLIMPHQSKEVLEKEFESLTHKKESLEKELSSLQMLSPVLEEENLELEDRLALIETTESSKNHESCSFTVLSGYIPLSRIRELEEYTVDKSVVLLLEEPEIAAEVPIKLKNRPFSRLFEPITKIFGLPAYIELDTTPFLAPFFALFFGLCLADVGYGIIVILMALGALIAVKKPGMRSIAVLGIVLGFMTVAGGIVLNTLFGTKLSEMSSIPSVLQSFIFLKDINDAMAFAIMLGVIQVMFGFILQMVNHFRTEGLQGGMQPLGTFLLIWGMIVFFGVGGLGSDFSIGPIPIGYWLSLTGDPQKIGLILTGIGLFLVLFFNNIKKKVFIRPLLGLWELYGIISGVPGDIISYIRLFALSLAGGLLGGAINQIAFMVRGEDPSILTIIPMLLILILGHAINFALAALGAFVHPLRLTFVEFYKAVGFTGGGIPYKPFLRKTANFGGKK